MIYTFFIGLGIYLAAFPQKVLLHNHVLQTENEPDDIKLNEALLLIDILKTEYVNLLRQNIQLRHGETESVTEDIEQSTCAPTIAEADASTNGTNTTQPLLNTETVPPTSTPPFAAPLSHQAILSRRAASAPEEIPSPLVARLPLATPSRLVAPPPAASPSPVIAPPPLANRSPVIAPSPLFNPSLPVAPSPLADPSFRNASPPLAIPSPQLAPLLPDILSPVIAPLPQATPYPEVLPWAGPMLQPYPRPGWQNVSATGAALPYYNFPQQSHPYFPPAAAAWKQPETPLQYYRRRMSDYNYFDWLRDQYQPRVGETYRRSFGPLSRRALLRGRPETDLQRFDYRFDLDGSQKQARPDFAKINLRRSNNDDTATQVPANATTASTPTNAPAAAAAPTATAADPDLPTGASAPDARTSKKSTTESPAPTSRATVSVNTDLAPQTHLTRTLPSSTKPRTTKQKRRKKVLKPLTNHTAEVKDPVVSQVASELMKEMRPLELSKQEKTPRGGQYSEEEEWPSYKTTLKIFLGKSTRYPIPLPENHAFCYTNPYNPLCRSQI